MSEVTTTKERVLKAAEKCSDAKAILKELFPDVFKEEKRQINVRDLEVIEVTNGYLALKEKGKGYYLFRIQAIQYSMPNGIEVVGDGLNIEAIYTDD